MPQPTKMKKAQSHSRRRMASINIQSWNREMSGSQGARSQYSKLNNCDMSEANMRSEIRPRNGKLKIENACPNLVRLAQPAFTQRSLESEFSPCFRAFGGLIICGLHVA